MFKICMLILAALLGVRSVLIVFNSRRDIGLKSKMWVDIFDVLAIIAVIILAFCSITASGIIEFLIGGLLGMAISLRVFGIIQEVRFLKNESRK